VPGHAISTIGHNPRGLLIKGCECGRTSEPMALSNVIGWENRHKIDVLEHAAVDAWNCVSCVEAEPPGECPNAEHDCGHHCNHTWTDGRCCWCGKEDD
jgi:hypothetical protein